ncbi:MAG: uracil-DNA glycosylase [Lentisphaeria bacterium]|nr:uracil-DNA glycosylase [Lentisphaeria bacterium]MBR2720310.1 uracil-DNA glycosylase [Lentisphaeria bacterium]
MAEFFDQICRILSETAAKYPGDPSDSETIREFFSDLAAPVPEATPASAPAVAEEKRSVPVQKPETVPAPAPAPVPAATLVQLQELLKDCQRCELCRRRRNIVFGEGDPDARLMFIGEAPGYDEDIQGRPFVGRAGELLNKMITAMQFTREEVYIANVIKCRPDDNRTPNPVEIDCCIPFLRRQIELIRPEVIVVLGAVAAKALLNTESGISRLRGRWCSYENIPVMPTFHPAYLLRNESSKKDAWQDLQQVMARFGKYHRR